MSIGNIDGQGANIVTKAFILTSLSLLSVLSLSSPSLGFEIAGAWANKVSSCRQVFQKTARGISFAKNSDAFGNGFIVEGDQIKGRIAVCKIKRRKQDGATLHLISSCATSVAFESVQFTLKFIDESKIVQIFPGVPELEVSYERCVL